MPVLDASVLVEYVAVGQHAEQVRERIVVGEPLWAPHLADAEVGHVLRRAVYVKEITAKAAQTALETLADMPLTRAPHRPLLERAWRLRENMSFYDALYVALAERLDMSLLTLDGRIAAAPGVRARIDVIAVSG